MESGSIAAGEPERARREAANASSGDKGLKSGAIGLVSSVVIGVASTAPGYSLAASLGFITADERRLARRDLAGDLAAAAARATAR